MKLAFTILFACVLSSCATVRDSETITPRLFLERFLTIYENSFIPREGIERLSPYLTTELNNDFRALLAVKNQADPKKDDLALVEELYNRNFFFGMNTSSSPESYRIGRTTYDGERAFVPVQLFWSSKVVNPHKSNVTFQLIKDQNSFKISDIVFSYPEEDNMLLTTWIKEITSTLKARIHAEQGAAANP